jgi:sialidase-1
MKYSVLLFVFGFSSLALHAEDRVVPVFVSGTEGYRSFRIPALIALPNRDLLAFCEGRVNGAQDFGNIDVVMKRSTDGGETWSPLQVVAEFGDLQLGNPAPVVDLTDPAFPQGRIFLFYNTGNNHEGEILKGHGIKSCEYKTSVDNGTTWSAPVDITTQVHRPKQPAINPAFNFPEDWRYTANTPGHAMQYQSGKYRGRIFVAANHSAGEPQKAAGHYAAHGYFSDDHGKTFTLGASVDLPGSNESMAVELSNNRLMMNSRNQRGDHRARIVTISQDGGATWDKPRFDSTLIDPVCQGSLLGLGMHNGQTVVAFCNAADTQRRDNLTLRISMDEGATWERSFSLAKAPEGVKGDYAAYSDMAQLDESRVGVLYEREGYSKIVFTRVAWK